MIDLQNYAHCPTLDEISEYVRNPVFDKFCAELQEKYKVTEQTEFSKCSFEPGWNIKFKKSGKSLCTIYPREAYFTVLVVIGKKEKERTEELLPECSVFVREIYANTREGNGQRWLMIDVEDMGAVYEDVLRLIEVRRKAFI